MVPTARAHKHVHSPMLTTSRTTCMMHTSVSVHRQYAMTGCSLIELIQFKLTSPSMWAASLRPAFHSRSTFEHRLMQLK